jgi:hypothetical protein
MQKSMNTIRSFVKKIQKRTLLSGLLVCFFLTNFLSHSIGYGFLSGVALGIVNFQLMSVDSYMIIDKSPQKARKFIINRAILRYSILFGFLVLIATRTDFNIIATFVGVFFVKFILIGEQIFQALGSRLTVKN